MSAYALVETINGHQWKPSSAHDSVGVKPMCGAQMCLSGHSTTLDQLAFLCPDPLGIAVLNRTLPEQLGLQLEAPKLPIDMLIVDHIERKPVEN